MITYLLVALGGAAGSSARYAVGLLAARWWGESFPWGTLLINIVGSFVIGWFGAATSPQGWLPGSPHLRLLVMVGMCGGFTTFSSFSLQTLLLAREGQPAWAAANILLSVSLCIVASTIGLATGARPVTITGRLAATPTILAIAGSPQTAAVAQACARATGATVVTTRLARGAIGTTPGIEVEPALLLGPDGRQANADSLLRQASLVVMESGGPPALLRDALLGARRAVLLVPPGASPAMDTIVVGWRPCRSLDRALRTAAPLLKAARKVVFLTIAEPDHPPAAPPASRMAANTSSQTIAPGPDGIAATLIQAASAQHADLLVTGAYARIALSESLLGGITRDLIAGPGIKLLLRH